MLEKINSLLVEERLDTIYPIDPNAQTILGNINSVRVGRLSNGKEVIIRCHPRGIKNGYFHVESLAAKLATTHNLPSYSTYLIHDLENEDDISFQMIEKLDGKTAVFYLKEDPDSENRIVYDLVDVVENRCTYAKALVRDKRYEGIFLLPAAQSRDKSAVTTTQMKHLIRQMEDSFDYILIDCPAGIEQGFENAVAAAKRAIVVAMPEVSSVRDADRIIGLLEKHEIKDIKLCINKLRPKMVENGSMLGIEDMLDILAIDLLGVVPDDEDIIVAANKGEYVSAQNSSRAGQAYRNIAARLNGEEVELMNMKESFFSKLFARRRGGQK